MKLLLPKDIIVWLDSHRGPASRQAFIISTIIDTMNSKNSNTYEVSNSGNNTKRTQGTNTR